MMQPGGLLQRRLPSLFVGDGDGEEAAWKEFIDESQVVGDSAAAAAVGIDLEKLLRHCFNVAYSLQLPPPHSPTRS